ncbi:hypothetical protein IMSHALPRED_008288 [Imshaugia aleurites]|uniref:Uncharacterized protein n=1 Tax=Imshaugia aleurites TaxID=172621 RepID=A0A8H3FTZ1_9LECA|nr:hypothetical protein IMSHALPRED_008288 [Imshaugia aleurites]
MLKRLSFTAFATLLALATSVRGEAVQDEAKVQSGPVIKIARQAVSDSPVANSTQSAQAALTSSTALLTCFTETDCTGFTFQRGLTFTANSPCVSAENCQCMIVQTLDNAHLLYWNGDNCKGAQSSQNGCFENGKLELPSAGTNSLGFHTGCI